MEWQCKKNLR